ncbi:aspartate 1-decarboxylase [Granulosicoccaceae sp. 1_MG-2023]|nr:aspartate 1-decarboxylase [Granulosicoccaceae sp. 1_MG-2023]
MKLRSLMHAKIHKATITRADLNYVGSITIDSALLDKCDLRPHERVLVVSNTSGARLETYIIAGEAHSGAIEMNGAAAHLIKPGDEVIIMAFMLTDEDAIPAKAILVDEKNRFVRYLNEQPGKTTDDC